MIQEIKLNGLNNEPVRTHKKQPPMSINKDLPGVPSSAGQRVAPFLKKGFN